jgi:hypothetical protein
MAQITAMSSGEAATPPSDRPQNEKTVARREQMAVGAFMQMTLASVPADADDDFKTFPPNASYRNQRQSGPRSRTN